MIFYDKEDKINKGEHRSKKAAPTPATFNNRKHFKEWVRIPIPKEIEDKEHDMKQTKHIENNKCPNWHRLGKLKGNSARTVHLT